MEWLDRPGSELPEGLVHTPPEIRPSPVWSPHYGVRAGRNARLVMTLILLVPTACLVLLGLFLLLYGSVMGVLPLMLAVPAAPVSKWIYEDLWRPQR